MTAFRSGIQGITGAWKDLRTYRRSPERVLEKSKVAFKIDTAGLKVAWWHLIIHMVPTAIMLTILSLTWRNVYWTDAGDRGFNVILSSLQFAAKAHEILILMSVSAIVLHTTRQHLVEGGVGLELLDSAYRLGGLVSLFHPSFWASFNSQLSATSPKLSWSWNLPFLILSTILLTATVGPSSAIVVIPKLDWWPDYPEYSSGATIWKPGSLVDYYPLDFTSEVFPSVNCTHPNPEDIQYCPPKDYELLLGWKKAFDNNPPNISIAAISDNIYRWLTSSHYPDRAQPAIATSVSEWFSSDIGYFWTALALENGDGAARPLLTPALPEGQRFLQPLVQVECEVSTYMNGSQVNLPHYNLKTPPLNDYDNGTWPIPGGILNRLAKASGGSALPSGRMPQFGFSLIDLSDHSRRPSLGMVLTCPSEDSDIEPSNGSVLVHACSVDARWVPHEVHIDPVVNDFIQGGLFDPSDYVASGKLDADIEAQSQDNSTAFQQIMIDSSYAEALAFTPGQLDPSDNSQPAILNILPGNVSNTSCLNTEGVETNETCWCWDMYLHEDTIDDGTSLIVSTSFAFTIASALAQHRGYTSRMRILDDQIDDKYSYLQDLTYSWGVSTNPSRSQAIEQMYKDFPIYENGTGFPVLYTDEWFPMTVRFSRYGYGYGLRGLTTYLAMAVLLVHVALALAHIAMILVTGWTSSVWDSMGEMMALAINSEPSSSLGNTCVGIDKTSTWRKIVQVREVREGHLSLLIQDDVDDNSIYRRPQAGKKYG